MKDHIQAMSILISIYMGKRPENARYYKLRCMATVKVNGSALEICELISKSNTGHYIQEYTWERQESAPSSPTMG